MTTITINTIAGRVNSKLQGLWNTIRGYILRLVAKYPSCAFAVFYTIWLIATTLVVAYSKTRGRLWKEAQWAGLLGGVFTFICALIGGVGFFPSLIVGGAFGATMASSVLVVGAAVAIGAAAIFDGERISNTARGLATGSVMVACVHGAFC
jgi:hypothetical protein